MVPVLLLCSIVVLNGCAVNAVEKPAQLQGGVEQEMVLEIGDDVLVRRKRAADICKYGKGTWSPCNSLTKLEARVDKLKTGSSGPTCPSSRQITRNCKKDKRKGKTDVGKKGKHIFNN
ncbi:uncharacterized protein LOC111700868 [Eurytemora carolleeae]|uniref:uncharacterized protein LOC111700868 n=1 Tax=Eurytemora carolleeae TaxID=1294199 RepID=UPI000C76F741|nr:uncharacterized protein LOC111700868 [Eurytemora carolleeae]|eukprot:XP_023327695.1 uncharacterized protein LOC111700868 [Eurytemora affinis]